MSLVELRGPASAQLAILVRDDNVNQPQDQIGPVAKQQYEFGAGAGQANKFYSAQISVPLSTTNTIVLDNASIADIFGNDVSFANIKSIRIKHADNSLSSSVTVGGTFMDSNFSTLLFAHVLPTGGIYFTSDSSAGYVVGAAETLTIENTDGSNVALVNIDLFGV